MATDVTSIEYSVGTLLDGMLSDAAALSLLQELAIDDTLTSDALLAAQKAVIERALPFTAPADAMDVCGTGGDGLHTRNISTAVAFVAAASGAVVVKHGNRAVSSRAGSSDVLDALGIPSSLTPAFWNATLESLGIAFLYAPHFHAGLVRIAPLRKQLGTRTIFNLLGPLCNPARVTRQLLGVYSAALVPILLETLQKLGSHAAWVVHGSEGGDELSIHGASAVAIVDKGRLRQTDITPEQAGLTRHPLDSLTGGDAQENAAAMLRLFAGEAGSYRDAVLLNAAATLIISGKATTLKEGVFLSAETIDSGRAATLLSRLQDAATKENL
jgi:anthranilate phosphoribosyltransferase